MNNKLQKVMHLCKANRACILSSFTSDLHEEGRSGTPHVHMDASSNVDVNVDNSIATHLESASPFHNVGEPNSSDIDEYAISPESEVATSMEHTPPYISTSMAECRNDVKPEPIYSANNAVSTHNVEGKTLKDAANYVGIVCGRIAKAVLKNIEVATPAQQLMLSHVLLLLCSNM